MGPCHHGCGSSHLIAKSEGETKKDKGISHSWPLSALQLGVKERIGIIKTKNIKKEGKAQAWSAENSALRRDVLIPWDWLSIYSC